MNSQESIHMVRIYLLQTASWTTEPPSRKENHLDNGLKITYPGISPDQLKLNLHQLGLKSVFQKPL